MPRPINLIVIHCSATPNGDSLFRGAHGEPGFQTPVQAIDGWHKARGFKRNDTFRRRQNPQLGAIGYHFVIYTNGAVATGRHLEEIGAHVFGNNKNSIGICLIGTDHYTKAQWGSLAALVAGLQKQYPSAAIRGHRDLSPDKNNDGLVQSWEWLKTCPGFDVRAWGKGGMKPLAGHILEASA